MAVGLGCLIAAGVVILGTALNGWALSIMWGWFMVPALGLPPLSIPSALGIALIVSMLTHQDREKSDKEPSTKEVVIAVLIPLLRPLIFLAFGWIYLQFM
jgi:hypothetical protein